MLINCSMQLDVKYCIKVNYTFTFYSTATHETVSLTQKMASAGADAVLVITPSYYKNAMNDVAMEMHYRAVSVLILVIVGIL